MRFIVSTAPHKQLEAKSNTKGDYRLEIPGITKPTTISIDAMKPGYRRLVGTITTGGDAKSVEARVLAERDSRILSCSSPHYISLVSSWTKKGSRSRGSRFGPISPSAHSWGGVGRANREPPLDGPSELFNYPVHPRVIRNELTRGLVMFSHREYVGQVTEDIYAAPDGANFCSNT